MSTSSITIGVVGHASVEKEMDIHCKHMLINHIFELQQKYSETIKILVAFSIDVSLNKSIIQVAQELGMVYSILLPVEKRVYMENIPLEMLDDFHKVCDNAASVQSVRLYPGISLKTYFHYGMDQRYQNFVCQKIICEESDEMIALWDGIVDYKIGSVSDAIRIRQKEFSKPVSIIFKLQNVPEPK